MSAECIETTSFMFSPAQLPCQRQLIYQLCDIHDSEVQQLICRNDNEESKFYVSHLFAFCFIFFGQIYLHYNSDWDVLNYYFLYIDTI